MCCKRAERGGLPWLLDRSAGLDEVDAAIDDWAVQDVLGVDRSVKSRTSYGGTAPANVRREARAWLRRLGAG